MGKYLDIAKRFEARLRAEGRLPSQRPASPPHPRTVYRELEDAIPPALPWKSSPTGKGSW